MRGWTSRLTALALLGACAHQKPSDDTDLLESSLYENTKEPEAPVAPDLTRTKLLPQNFSADGFPRVRRYDRGTSYNSTTERIETDFNGDGRIDFIQWYDQSGQWVVKESADLDGDGVMDVTSFYKKTLAQKEAELEHQEFYLKSDGRPAVWKYYEHGQLVRRELDRRGTGKADLREFYENGKLVRVEKDGNSDKPSDSRLQLKAVVKPSGPEPGTEPPPAR